MEKENGSINNGNAVENAVLNAARIVRVSTRHIDTLRPMKGMDEVISAHRQIRDQAIEQLTELLAASGDRGIDVLLRLQASAE